MRANGVHPVASSDVLPLADSDPYAEERVWLLRVIGQLPGPVLLSLRQFLEVTPVVAAIMELSQHC
jgi:hypothetical protein